MNVYVFSSSNLTNIWAGIGARLWGVSAQQASMAATPTKAASMPVGALGLLYCVETQSFTTPFLVRTQPQQGTTISHVWPEPWQLPFGIVPLGSPNRQLHKDAVTRQLPTIVNGGGPWHHLLHIQPTTVFVPSVLSDADWTEFIQALAA
jgi:hypothetical protein